MNCKLELIASRDSTTGIYKCAACGKQIPLPKRLAGSVKRQCEAAPPQESCCKFRGKRTGYKIDCGCKKDTSLFVCNHHDNAKQKAVLNLPKFKADYWECASCERKDDEIKPIRVCFLTPGFWMGGAECWIVSLTKGFDPQKVRVDSVVVRDKNQKNTLMVEALPRWVEFLEGKEHLIEAANKADVLISWGCGTLEQLTHGVEVPIIDVHHGANDNDYMASLVKASMDTTKHVVAVSDACKLQFKEYWERVTLIPNGADIERVAPKKGRKETRSELGVRDAENLVACISRIMPDKRVESLVDAVRRLPANVKLLLCGPMMHYTEQDVARWRKTLGHRLIIKDAVHHVGDYLAAADCFALASMSEAHPLAVNEAWLAGLPVAMMRLPWVDWLEQKYGPMVYAGGNLSQAISEALNDTQQLGAKAKAIAWSEYTSAAMAQRWEDYIAKVVRDNRRGH